MKRRSSDAAMRGTDGGNLLQGEKGADKVRRAPSEIPTRVVEIREEHFQTPRHTPFILLL